MSSNGTPPKVPAHAVVYAETAVQSDFLLKQPSRTEAVRKFVGELLASFRRTQFQNRDVQLEGLDFAHEKIAAETVRGWVMEILEALDAKNHAAEVRVETPPPVPGALRGRVTRIAAEYAHVATDGRSYNINRGIPGAHAGTTEVWILPTGERNGGKLNDARLVCKVGEEPKKPAGTNGAQNGVHARTRPRADTGERSVAPRESRV